MESRKKLDVAGDSHRNSESHSSIGEWTPRSPFSQIWQRRWIVLAAATTGCLIAGAYCIFATPIYTATSRIIATSDVPHGISAATKEAQPNNLYTELSIIGSSTIFSDASALLDDPQWYWDNGYEVLVNGERLHDARVLLQGKPLAVNARKPAPTGAEVVRLHTFDGQGRIAYLRRKIQASVGKDDQLITVSLDSPFIAEAPVIVNAVVDAYLNFSSAQKHSSAEEVVRALQQKHDEFQLEIRAKGQAVSDLVRQNPSLYLNEGKSNPIQQRVESLSAELTNANLQMLDASHAYDDAAKQAIHDPIVLKELINDGTYDGKLINAGNDELGMLKEIRFAETTLSDLRRTYFDEHPAVQAAMRKLGEVNAAHVLFLHHQYKAQEDRVKLFQAEFDEANKAAQTLSVKLAEYEGLKSDLFNANHLMQALETRIAEIHVDDGPSTLTLRVLEPASEPIGPSKPVKLLVLFEGLMAGLLAGVGLTFMDRRLRSVDEITTKISLPVLSIVPRMSGVAAFHRGRVVNLDPVSDVAEAFRSLRGAVTLGRQGKTILVTSSIRGEGKSTVASNLAIALAEAGHKVLLVDADLRMPVQHEIHEIYPMVGLSDVLEGKVETDAATCVTAIDRLELIPCGPVPRNPGQLLDTDAFADVLKSLTKKYDYVVLDSPPVLPVTDARILASMCDSTVLVVRAEKTTGRAATDARDGLIGFGANLIGIIVNAGKRAKNSYGYYGGYGLHQSARVTRAASVATSSPAIAPDSSEGVSEDFEGRFASIASAAVRQKRSMSAVVARLMAYLRGQGTKLHARQIVIGRALIGHYRRLTAAGMSCVRLWIYRRN